MHSNKRFQRFGVAALLVSITSLLLLLIKYWYAGSLIWHYAAVLSCAWLGAAVLLGGFGRQLDEKAALITIGWCVAAAFLHRDLRLDQSAWDITLYAFAPLIALPCARLMGRGAVTATAAFLFAVVGAMAVLCISIAMTTGWVEVLFLQEAIGVMNHDHRLMFSCHPNELACLFLIAIFMGLWLVCRTHRRWLCLPAVMLGALMYAGIAMTGSRTAMLQTALMAGLMAACLLMNTKWALWKKLLAAAAAFAAVFAVVFAAFPVANELVNVLSLQLAQAEELITDRPILQDLATMTGRTGIYERTFGFLADKLRVIFIGTGSDPALVSALRETIRAYHTHNSFLQTLVTYGLPGLACALWFAFRAVWAAWRVLPSARPLECKMPALFTLVLLLGAIPETYLFASTFPLCNVVFFFCLGAAVEEAKKPDTSVNHL